MSLSLLTNPEAVETAIEEYNRLGEDVFLTKYGFSRSGNSIRLGNG